MSGPGEHSEDGEMNKKTHDSKLEHWWSVAEPATSRSRRLNRYQWAKKKHCVSLKPEYQRGMNP